MSKNMREEATERTQQCIERYWRKDSAYALEQMEDDITWIGAVEREFMHGKEAVRRDLEETTQSNPICHLLNQEFWCVTGEKGLYVVIGRYLVTTEIDCGELIQEQQRATFVWKLVGKELRILHMHISQPIGYLEEGEVFPHKIGKMSYYYLQHLIKKHSRKWKHIQIKDMNGHLYFLSEAEIESAEAKDHNTVINTLNGNITGRINWKDFLPMLSDCFVKVHRSFVINLQYIRTLKTTEVEMQSGRCIPIPVKKRKETFQRISAALYEP